MRINHNIAALNTYRQLTANTASTSRSLEKLSSGLRINRAGDDAAGLAISEKMRSQIRGLDQASRNAQDGISLIQTAEGALNETHSILQRMRELAVQSATDTNTSNDRAEIQKEIDQLAVEVTRIANDTEFNTQKLLNGAVTETGMGRSTFHIGANAGQNVALDISAMDAKSLGISRDVVASANGTASAVNIASSAFTGEFGTGIVDGAVLSFNYTDAVTPVSPVAAQWNTGAVTAIGDDTNGTFIFNGVTVTVNTGGVAGASVTGAKAVSIGIANGATAASTAQAILDAVTAYKADVGTADGSLANFTFSSAAGGDGINITGRLEDGNDNNALAITGTIGIATGGLATVAGGGVEGVDKVAGQSARVEITSSIGHTQTVSVDGTASSLTINTGNFKGMSLTLATDIATDLDGAATLTIAATSDMASEALFANGALTDNAVTAAGIDVSTRAFANSAITNIDTAISTVSSERAKLGSIQNRLEHTINNLGTTSENLSASESRVRDVDMAKEMMEFTKNNILSQAAQAMLAQANMQPQSVLQLLQ